jgi:hypothetical protein
MEASSQVNKRRAAADRGTKQKDGETKRGDGVNESILGPLKDRSVLVLPCFTCPYSLLTVE